MSAMEPMILSPDELAKYDGNDTTLPLLICVKGIIFDVSPGRDFYGPGKHPELGIYTSMCLEYILVSCVCRTVVNLTALGAACPAFHSARSCQCWQHVR